jgi:hypothetical protein
MFFFLLSSLQPKTTHCLRQTIELLFFLRPIIAGGQVFGSKSKGVRRAKGRGFFTPQSPL